MLPIQKFQFYEDSAVTLLGRMVGQAGTAITQASLSTITAKIRRIDSGIASPTTTSVALTISSVVFDTLQTSDPRWADELGVQLDSTGFNFAARLAKTYFADGPGLYNVDVAFIPTSGSGDEFCHVWNIETVRRWNA